MNEYIISCGTINYTCGERVMRELEYLSRWRADLAYIVECFGGDDPEAEVSRKSIRFAFDQLDKLGCPFWLQNCALAYGEDWRNYIEGSHGQVIADFSAWLVAHGYGFRERMTRTV